MVYDSIFHSKLGELGDHLKIKIPNTILGRIIPTPKSFMEGRINYFVELNDLGDFITRDKEFLSINALLYDLNILKRFNNVGYKKFTKWLRTATYDKYFGYRLECHIAALLTTYQVNRQLTFSISESPDFTINVPSKIYIECTSRHLNVEKGDNTMAMAIKNSIETKNQKPYSNNRTALFIDITNLVSLNWKFLENNGSADTTRNYIESLVKESKFGSVVCLCWMMNYSSNKYECMFNRYDNDKMDGGLCLFLDKYWPLGFVNPKTFHVPKIG